MGSSAALHLVHSAEPKIIPLPLAEQLADHEAILGDYLDTYDRRGYSEVTLKNEQYHLTRWFHAFPVADERHPGGQRQIFVWEAMEPGVGRDRIITYSKCMVAAELARSTIRGRMTSLRRFFEYVLAYPYIPGRGKQRIDVKYGPIEQPVLVYDYPRHVFDSDWAGNFLSEQQLAEFYAFIHDVYVQRNQKVLAAWRDYAMIVLAGESGLRATEFCGIDALGPQRDLFYERGRVRTRQGKGFNGSGRLVRETILTPFAQQVLQAYELQVRPHFRSAATELALFLSENGPRMSYSTAYQALRGIVKAARAYGLDIPADLNWHDFRRSFATNFNEREPAEIFVLMELMGHRNPTTLHRYVKPSQSHVDRVMDSYVRKLTGFEEGE